MAMVYWLLVQACPIQTSPDLSLRDFTGQTRLWVEVVQPEDKPLNKACQKAEAVMVYCFNHAAEVWWKGIESKLTGMDELQVWRVPTEASQSTGQVGRANAGKFKRQCKRVS
jgi:uncharacterized protein YaeQ